MVRPYDWDWEREDNFNPIHYNHQIPSGFENLITNVKDIKEYTIRAGSNRDNILRNFDDWMVTILTALRILISNNPYFSRAKITTSYNILQHGSLIFESYLNLSVRERILALNEISDWGYGGTDDIFVITDGETIVKTEIVEIIREPFVEYIRKGKEMDRKYPHICFECGKKIYYEHARLQAKKEKIEDDHFKELWKSENVEFYCCSCYRKTTETVIAENDSNNNGREYISW